MPILSYSDGAEIIHHTMHGVTVFETNNIRSINKVIMPQHALFLPQSRNVCSDTWEGIRAPRDEWMPGDGCFLPARSELHSDVELPYNERVVLLEDRLFIKAATDHVDHSRIEFRFGRIKEQSALLVAQALTHLATCDQFYHWPMLVEANAYSLAISLICSLSPSSTTAFQEKPYGLSLFRLKRVTEYIDANLSRAISLAELADLATVSPFHFSRLFKKRVGVSVMEYVVLRRVEVAKKKLQTTGDTLSSIAYECGFASQSHFTGTFKRVIGTTPAVYRKQVR